MPREGRPDRAALSAVDRRWRSLKWRANRESKLESLPDDEKEKEKARLRAADRARVRRYRARIRQQREAAAALAGLDVDAQSRTRTRSSSGPPPSPPPSPPPRGACPALCPTLQRLVRLEDAAELGLNRNHLLEGVEESRSPLAACSFLHV